MNLFKREHIRNAREIVQGGHIAWYVGRPSPLGNPYRMEKESQRDEVIRKHKEHMQLRLEEAAYGMQDKTIEELHQLIKLFYTLGSCSCKPVEKNIYLLCWCPLDKKCHCDILCAILNSEEAREFILEIVAVHSESYWKWLTKNETV